MRTLLLALLLVGHQAQASCLANTVDFWPLENSLAPTCGTDNLVQVGTVPFVTTPTACQGTYMAGAFSSANYLSTTASAMNGLAAWAAEGYVYANTLTSAPVIYSAWVTSSNAHHFRILSNGAVRIILNDAAFADSAAGVVTTGICLVWGMTYDGTTLRGYAGAAPQSTAVVSLTGSGTYPTNAFVWLGRYPMTGIEFPLDGYMDAIRLSSVQRTTFPSLDPVPTATPTPASGVAPYIPIFRPRRR
jgi:hypothetical protein